MANLPAYSLLICCSDKAWRAPVFAHSQEALLPAALLMQMPILLLPEAKLHKRSLTSRCGSLLKAQK